MEPLQRTTPTILVLGEAGVGKKALISTLVRAKLRSVPEAGDICAQDDDDTGIPVYCLDITHTATEDLTSRILQLLPSIDIVLWVVAYGTSLQQEDVLFLQSLRPNFPDLPILIVGTGIDKGAAIFTPATFSPESGEDPAERAANAWHEELATHFAEAKPADIILCTTGSSPADISRHYNLPALSAKIEELLPKSTRMRWIAEEKVGHDRGEKADKMILAATTAAGAIGLIPLPIADMPFIVATQVALIVSLSSLYGKAFTKDAAHSLVLAALSALAGPIAFQNIVKVLPGLGSVVGGGVAGACTYAVGKVTKMLLERNEALTLSVFTTAVKNVFKEYREHKKDA